MLLGLALLLALLDCAVAGAFSLWMGIGLNAGVLALSAIRLALVAIPVIGLSLCVQSLLSGRFSDPTAQGLVPLMVTTIVVLGIQIPGQMLWSLSLTDWVVFAGYGKVLPSPSLWIGLTLAVLFGAGGVLLAARRFQRVDF
jgi:hypothetical protein